MYQESALGPWRKVLELLKSINFAFGIFLSSVEEVEEKQTWTSAQFKLNWNSEFFQKPLKFSRSYTKIGSVLDQTPINKVVALTLRYKFSFGQNLSSVQNPSEKSSGKSSKLIS